MAATVRASMERVLVGKGHVIDLILTAVMSGGTCTGGGCSRHREDHPGPLPGRVAELQLSDEFSARPDLMPSDITGVHYYNQKLNEFEFRPGPILAQVVLADEINRATPRTQSALLEAMAEGQVTVDDRTFSSSRNPFILVATQNPIELEGTFPSAGGATGPIHASAAEWAIPPRMRRSRCWRASIRGNPRRLSRSPWPTAVTCRRDASESQADLR